MNEHQSQPNFDIRLSDHFKLYVLLKDKVLFESELRKNGIRFNSNINEQPYIEDGIRYFLLDADRKRIDDILIENEIIASTETIPGYDYRDETKTRKLQVVFFIAIISIILLIALFEYFITNA